MTTGADAGDTERACPSLPAVRNGVSLIRTKAAITVTQRFRNPAERRASQEVHLGGYAVGRIRGSWFEMTTRIREFLKHRTENGPCLVLYPRCRAGTDRNFAKALPDSKVFYAIKANPAPEIQ